jgi:UDP-N-acetylmuramyl-tripeptide synthetase
MNGIACGYIGTGKALIGDREILLERTTPEAHGLHRLFRRMIEGGCRAVSMEVSSHALELKRVHGVAFDAAVYTNLTPDHLDFHPTMDSYAESKRRLFDQLAPGGFGIFNTDDPKGAFMAARVPEDQRACCSLTSMPSRGIRCARNYGALVRSQGAGSSVVALSFPGGVELDEEFRLPGRFNVMNMLEAVAAAHLLGVPVRAVAASVPMLRGVEGRMELVEGPGIRGMSIVDYAHTPDALENVIQTIKDIQKSESQLITVIGCGGNRDAEKRPQMGAIASHKSQRCVFTSDNPRNEDPSTIIEEMMSGVEPINLRKVLKITDRAEAIKTAVALSFPGDVILIAGKGHETYQETNGVRIEFDDRIWAQKALNDIS